MIDFESLLRRYIGHVQDCEGTDFISDMGFYQPLTEEESEWLTRTGQEEWANPIDRRSTIIQNNC